MTSMRKRRLKCNWPRNGKRRPRNYNFRVTFVESRPSGIHNFMKRWMDLAAAPPVESEYTNIWVPDPAAQPIEEESKHESQPN